MRHCAGREQAAPFLTSPCPQGASWHRAQVLGDLCSPESDAPIARFPGLTLDPLSTMLWTRPRPGWALPAPPPGKQSQPTPHHASGPEGKGQRNSGAQPSWVPSQYNLFPRLLRQPSLFQSILCFSFLCEQRGRDLLPVRFLL